MGDYRWLQRSATRQSGPQSTMDPFNHCGLAGSSWPRLGSRGKRSLIRRGFVTGEHHQQPLLSPITPSDLPRFTPGQKKIIGRVRA
jgi:hypothetical protein